MCDSVDIDDLYFDDSFYDEDDDLFPGSSDDCPDRTPRPRVVLVIIGVILFVFWLFILTGCAATPTQSWTATPVGSGSVYQLNTQTGRGYVIMPQGVIDLGTPDKPVLDAKARDTGADGEEAKPISGKIQLGKGE